MVRAIVHLKEARLQNTVLTNRNGIRRPFREGKQAHLCKARSQQSFSGRCRRDRMKDKCLTWGDLGIDLVSMSQEVSRGHSSQRDMSRHPRDKGGVLTS